MGSGNSELGDRSRASAKISSIWKTHGVELIDIGPLRVQERARVAGLGKP